MTTTWLPHDFEPHTWTLINGETIQEPALQITEGGRRMRIASSPEHSFWTKDQREGIRKYMDEVAAARQSALWFVLTKTPTLPEPGEMRQVASPEEVFSLVTPKPSRRDASEKLLTAFFENSEHGVVAKMSITVIKSWYRHGYDVHFHASVNVTDPDFPGRNIKIKEWDAKASEPSYNIPLIPAAAKTLKLLQSIDRPSIEVSIPHGLPGEKKCKDITLDFVTCNYADAVRTGVRELVDRGLEVKEIRRVYGELRDLFARTGIILEEDINMDQFLLALVSSQYPENVGIVAQIIEAPSMSEDLSPTLRATHKVGIDLLNGKFHIECGKALTGEALHAYEMAKMREDLTGQTGEVESYIEAYTGERLGRASAEVIRREEADRHERGTSARRENK